MFEVTSKESKMNERGLSSMVPILESLPYSGLSKFYIEKSNSFPELSEVKIEGNKGFEENRLFKIDLILSNG